MRSSLSALLVTAAVAAGGLAISSCGAEDVSVDVAEAAAATGEQGTARMEMTMKMDGLGLPTPITVRADGVTALRKPRTRFEMDFGPLLSLAGAGGEGTVEMVLDGASIYVKPPQLDGLDIPGDKPWVAVDLGAAADAAGVPTEGFEALVAVDPASQLRALRAAKGLEDLGTEEIDGVETTHYKGTTTPTDIIDELPQAERREGRKALETLEALNDGAPGGFDDSAPVELWIDGDGLARRMRTSSELPAGNGIPGGSFEVDYSLSDFGAELDVSAPPASDSYDATGALASLLEQVAPALR
ncbi:MAG: hypothetical protein ACR2GL_06440 [Thermoleophilaceae bacterium]